MNNNRKIFFWGLGSLISGSVMLGASADLSLYVIGVPGFSLMLLGAVAMIMVAASLGDDA